MRPRISDRTASAKKWATVSGPATRVLTRTNSSTNRNAPADDQIAAEDHAIGRRLDAASGSAPT